MNSNYAQFALATTLVLMLGALTDPFMYWMPSVPQMLALLVATVCLLAWVGFVVREEAGDEREAGHRMFAGRAAYLAGIALLTLALILQGMANTIDPWIPGALIGMVLTKLIARWYADTFF